MMMSTATTPITSSSSITGTFAVEETSTPSSPWIPLDGTERPNVPWNGPNLRTMVHDDNDSSVDHHTFHPEHMIDPHHQQQRDQTNRTTDDDDQVDPLHNLDDCDTLSPPAHDPSAVQLPEDGQEIMIRDGHEMMIRTMEETGYFTEEYLVGASVKKVLYPLRDLSVRLSGILATFVSHTNTCSSTSSVLVVQLYDPPHTVLALCIDDRIQYAIPYHDPLSPSPAPKEGPSVHLTCRSLQIYEMMTHIPMCSVKSEPSYILIWNATMSRRSGNQRRQRQRNSNQRMTGYGIVQQLLRHYTSSIYKIVLVEEDPAIYDIYQSYFDTNGVVREDERVTVVHHPPFDDPQSDVTTLDGRYHVIFVIDDHDHVHDNNQANVNIAVDRVEVNLPSTSHAQPPPPPPPTPSDSYRHSIYRALVPNGGVACFLTRPNNVNENDSPTIPIKYEYAALPSVAWTSIESSEMILQLCIRRTNHHDTVADAPTCRRPIRTPTSTTLHPLHWYSSDTHVSAFTLPPVIQRQLFTGTTTYTTTVPVQEKLERTPTMPTRATPSGHRLDDVMIENDATTCQPFGGIGENVHRWIQRHWSNVTTKFVLVPH